MAGYTKLFGSILDSTVWQQPLPSKVVWITMLAMADRDGVVEASVPGLALRAGVTRSDCEAALASFLAPDPDSRTRDHGGRRIVEVHGGWRLLNYEAYRDKGDIADVRKKAAARQQRYRERHGISEDGDVTVTSRSVTVTPSNGKSRQAAASAAAAATPSASATPSPVEQRAVRESGPVVVATPDPARSLARYLFDSIKLHTPHFGADPKRWENEIRLMLQADKIPEDAIRLAIDFAHRGSDPFWRSRVVSGKALRDKFGTLTVQAANPQRAPAGRGGGLTAEELLNGPSLFDEKGNRR